MKPKLTKTNCLGSAEARSTSSLRVAMNQKSGAGFFCELSESNLVCVYFHFSLYYV